MSEEIRDLGALMADAAARGVAVVVVLNPAAGESGRTAVAEVELERAARFDAVWICDRFVIPALAAAGVGKFVPPGGFVSRPLPGARVPDDVLRRLEDWMRGPSSGRAAARSVHSIRRNGSVFTVSLRGEVRGGSIGSANRLEDAIAAALEASKHGA